MRVGGPNLKDGPSVVDGERGITDWVNLPQGTDTIGLWDCLHDAQVVSIRSNLLDRAMTLSCEIEHLRSFNGLPEGLQFVLSLDGVQSARVVRYAIWPGEFTIPPSVSREEEARLVADYQAKWREESVTWSEFEAAVTRENEQVLDISNATVALSPEKEIALRLCGHLNYATYHEVFIRATHLRVSGTDGKALTLEEFQTLGQRYWNAFAARSDANE